MCTDKYCLLTADKELKPLLALQQANQCKAYILPSTLLCIQVINNFWFLIIPKAAQHCPANII